MYIEKKIEVLEELDIFLYLKTYLTEQIKDKENVNDSISLIISIFEDNAELINLLKDKFGKKMMDFHLSFKFNSKFKENLILYLNERFENDYKNNIFQQVILSPYVSNENKINLYKTYSKFISDDFTEIFIDICFPNFSFNSLKEYIENIIKICENEKDHVLANFYNNTEQNQNVINQLSFINEDDFIFIFQTIEYNKDINKLNDFLKESLLILSKELWDSFESSEYNNVVTINSIMERTIYILESLFKNDFLIQKADINILNQIRNKISKFKRNHEINNLYNVIKWENYSSTKIIGITDREIKELLSLPNFNNNIELQKKIFPHLKFNTVSEEKCNQLQKTIKFIIFEYKNKNINMNKFIDFLTIYSNEIINNNNYLYDYIIKELNISNAEIPERIKTIFSSNENDFKQTFNKISLNLKQIHLKKKESVDLLTLYFKNPFFMKYVYEKSESTFFKISKYIREGIFENNNTEYFLNKEDKENKNLKKIEITENYFLENYIAEEIKTILYKKIFKLFPDLSDYNYSKEVFELLINNYKFIEEKSEGSLLRIYNKCSEKEMIDFFQGIYIQDEDITENIKSYKENLLNNNKSRFEVIIKENIQYIQEKIKIITNQEFVIFNKDNRLEILIVKDKIKKENIINFNF